MLDSCSHTSLGSLKCSDLRQPAGYISSSWIGLRRRRQGFKSSRASKWTWVILWKQEICHCCHSQFSPCPCLCVSLTAFSYCLSPLLTLRLDNHLEHPLQDLLDSSSRTHNWICPIYFPNETRPLWLAWGVILRGIWLGHNWIWGIRSNAQLFPSTATITPTERYKRNTKANSVGSRTD